MTIQNTLQRIAAGEDQCGATTHSSLYWRKIAVQRAELLKIALKQLDVQGALVKKLTDRIAELETGSAPAKPSMPK
jgi:hypothetical protein